jgi:hypothetical protein
MISTGVGILATLALAQADPALAEAAKGYAHAWAGFREGSTVTIREKTRTPEIDEKGNLVHREVVAESVWTVTGVAGERATVRVKQGGQDHELPYHFTPPHWFRGKVESKGREAVAVGARTFDCAVTSITFETGKDIRQVTTLWKAADAPSWAVRLRIETFERGSLNTSEDERLVAVDERVKVGEKEVVCQVVEATTEAAGRGKTVRKEWRSPEVPGRVVRRETRQFQGGKEITLAASQMEVVSFTTRK